MTITEHQAPPKPKRKPERRRQPRRAVAPREPADELDGLTATDCCAGCHETRCVISQGPVCAHPFKGNLQSGLMMRPDVVRRHNAAKRRLAHQKVDLRGQ